MLKVVSVEEMRAIEATADKTVMSYEQMMLNAGRAAATYLINRLSITAQTRITLLIGKGNNGGDGLVVAHHLAQNTEAQIRLYMLETRTEDDKNFQAIAEDNLLIANAVDDHDGRVLKNMINSADIIVDALFGIGLRLPLRDTSAKILRTVKQAIQEKNPIYGDELAINPTKPMQFIRQPKPFVYAIDCPSGIDCDTGEVDSNVVTADVTITFIAGKLGLFTFPASQYVGELVISQIGLPDTLPALQSKSHFIIDNQATLTRLPERPLDGHKGTFGKAFIVAGSSNYVGAAVLSGESAYRSGAGLVTIAVPTPLVNIIASQLREPTYIHLPSNGWDISEQASQTIVSNLTGYQALLIGPGLGQHEATNSVLHTILESENLPALILDADALNMLGQQEQWWKKIPDGSIVTPHPGEMSRLTGKDTRYVNANRWQLAADKAKEWNVVVVLKGAHTIIASPDGQVGVIPFKTDALGTAGTGDVLAGLITGLRAQGNSPFDSAIVGAYVHALAGLNATEAIGSSRSVIAGDVLENLGRAFQQVEMG